MYELGDNKIQSIIMQKTYMCSLKKNHKGKISLGTTQEIDHHYHQNMLFLHTEPTSPSLIVISFLTPETRTLLTCESYFLPVFNSSICRFAQCYMYGLVYFWNLFNRVRVICIVLGLAFSVQHFICKIHWNALSLLIFLKGNAIKYLGLRAVWSLSQLS